MAVSACASAPPVSTRCASGAAARAPARSSLGRPAAAGRPRGPQPRRGSTNNTARAVAAPVRRAAPQRPSRRPLTARADVNWDAFRSGIKLNPYNSTALKRHSDPPVRQFDFVVIGSGIAGLSYALKVAQYGSVAIVTKEYANDGCTQYAQGGVCAVLDAQDSVENHVNDTMVAGGFLNDSKAVEVVCREGPARVLELAQLGAEFTRSHDGALHLTREGGHSHRRIVHAADLTGREIERALLESARQHPAISFFEHHLAVDLVLDEAGGGVQHCFGVDVLDQVSHKMMRFIGLATMLASGGAGQVYPNTTNPAVATGDGIAMAFRGGASISNMEFVQFHPTALAGQGEGGRVFLISEAVRGEGGQLFNLAGERFMTRYDDRMELAPRDVVARAIHEQMTTRGEPHVLLDISHKGRDAVLSHFPNIAQKCAASGIDITAGPIPVLPAQHYTCGGVATGLLGETTIQGLFATGEVACSGLHGANRLASNSLLEGLVFADRAVGPSVAHAEYALKQCGRQLHYAAASADFSGARGARPLAGATAAWAAERRAALRALMWKHAGIVRSTAGLRAALDEIAATYVEVKAVASAYGVNTQLVELRNLVTCAELVVSCALQRRESRGLHYTTDFPRPVASECRPSMISTSLRARYDLDPLQSTIGRRPNGFISSIGLGAEAGGGASGNVSVGGGFGSGKGVRGGARQQGVPSKGRAAARDLSVRSERADVE